jgi:putative peptide zinc metalloprotease protein
MAQSLFSDRWYRVADLHPRMRANVVVDRQVVRGDLWILLSTGARSRTFRLNMAAWSFVGRCSAERSMQQVWDMMLASEPEHTPTQDEVVQLLTRLYQAGLVEFERSPDVELMLEQTRRADRSERNSRMNPLSFRVSFGDPSALLEPWRRVASAVFGRAGLAAWFALMFLGLGIVVGCYDAVVRHAEQWMHTPRYILIGWLCYPVIKAIHEVGHALAVMRWGGRVHEAGVGLFFLLPMPFVDASEANRFPSAGQRAMVSAAGIMAEMAVAVLGLALWSVTEAGLVHDVAFSFAFIGGVSTLMFNANPLMRLDGYYFLADLKQLPNLAGRSASWWQWLTTRYVLHIRDREPPAVAPGELPWLVVYGPLAWAYRVLLAVWMIVWGGSYHPMLGVLVALATLVWMIGMPIVATLRSLAQGASGTGRGMAGRFRIGTVLALVVGAVTLTPVPDRMIAQGVVWLPEQAHVRPQVEGFLKTIAAPDSRVAAGEAVAWLEDPALETERQRLSSRREGLATGLYQALASDTFKGKQVSEEIVAIEQQLAHIDARLAELVVRSDSAGALTAARLSDMPGRYYKQGSELAFVVGDVVPVVRVAVHQEDAARLRDGVQAVTVRLAQRADQSLTARVARFTPSAVERLPTAALGDRAGGDIMVEPSDKDGTRSILPVYTLDLDVADLPVDQVGGRAWVRFDYGWSPITVQLFRYLKQLVLIRFSPFES